MEVMSKSSESLATKDAVVENNEICITKGEGSFLNDPDTIETMKKLQAVIDSETSIRLDPKVCYTKQRFQIEAEDNQEESSLTRVIESEREIPLKIDEMEPRKTLLRSMDFLSKSMESLAITSEDNLSNKIEPEDNLEELSLTRVIESEPELPSKLDRMEQKKTLLRYMNYLWSTKSMESLAIKSKDNFSSKTEAEDNLEKLSLTRVIESEPEMPLKLDEIEPKKTRPRSMNFLSKSMESLAIKFEDNLSNKIEAEDNLSEDKEPHSSRVIKSKPEMLSKLDEMEPTKTLLRSMNFLSRSMESLSIKSEDNLSSKIEAEDYLRKSRLARCVPFTRRMPRKLEKTKLQACLEKYPAPMRRMPRKLEATELEATRPPYPSVWANRIRSLSLKGKYDLREASLPEILATTPSRWALNRLERTAEPRETLPKLSDFMSQIFQWDPTWLEEPEDFSPPVVKKGSLTMMLETYTSFGEYHKIVEPLVTLEIWHSIYAYYTEEKKKLKTFTVSSRPCGSSEFYEDEILGCIDIDVDFISHKELLQDAHPAKGDLVRIDYISVSASDDGLQFSRREAFAYVTGMVKNVIDPSEQHRWHRWCRFSGEFLKIRIKTLDLTRSEQRRITTIRKIAYIRSNVRTIRALQGLHASRLKDMIFRPEIENYRLPSADNTEMYRLVTKHDLNPRQKEAVIRVTETVSRRMPKICLIQGPPGTGKSKVVVNLVMQILDDNNRTGRNLKILVCAPSNKAVDEVVLRLCEINESPENPNEFSLVRVGRIDAMHPDVRGLSLENRSERLKKRRKTEKDGKRNRNRSSSPELTKREREHLVLRGSNVIASTLNSSFTIQMESAFRTDRDEQFVCIIDEASQCTEPESFIPLMLNVTTLILVGDPKQLPATILSQEAKRLGFGESLFARIDKLFEGKSNNPKIQLDVQYRMSNPVALFPNDYFYGGMIKNAAKNLDLPFHHYRVINLDSIQNRTTLANPREAVFVIKLLHRIILAREGSGKPILPLKVGIITPYKDQKKTLMSKILEFKRNLKTSNEVDFEVNTIDSYQGQERDIIIMSCVRSRGIGFLSDPHRLCVALTRAKHSLFVCGNFQSLQKHPMWNALLTDAKSREVFVNARWDVRLKKMRPYIIRQDIRKEVGT